MLVVLEMGHTGVAAIRLPRLAALAGMAALAALLVVISQALAFSHDEIEHVHAAWHVSAGRLPYRDFFQNHHPLFYYLLAPALGSRPWPTDLLAIRAGVLLVAFGIAAATFRLALEATASRRIAWTAVVLLLTCSTFVRAGIEIRPDVPFALAATVAYVFFARAVRTRGAGWLGASGAALAAGLLFHQKAIVVVGALAVAGAWEWRGRGVLRAAWLVVPSLGALVLVAAWFDARSALRDYWAMAWVFPSAAARASSHHGYGQLEANLLQNAWLWVAALAGGVFAFARSRTQTGSLRPLALTAALLLASVAAGLRVFDQYFLPAWPLVAVLAASALVWWAERGRRPGRRLVVAAGVVAAVPVAVLFSWTRPAHGEQIERMAFVAAITPAGGAVYDGDNRLNLFREDVHHFWYAAGREPETSVYNRVAGPGRTPYDGCAAIRLRQPRVISDFQIDLAGCGLLEHYRAVLPGIYLNHPPRRGAGR